MSCLALTSQGCASWRRHQPNVPHDTVSKRFQRPSLLLCPLVIWFFRPVPSRPVPPRPAPFYLILPCCFWRPTTGQKKRQIDSSNKCLKWSRKQWNGIVTKRQKQHMKGKRQFPKKKNEKKTKKKESQKGESELNRKENNGKQKRWEIEQKLTRATKKFVYGFFMYVCVCVTNTYTLYAYIYICVCVLNNRRKS